MSLQELKMLTHLNLSCNRFTLFPLEAVLNQRLVHLDLSANKVQTNTCRDILKVHIDNVASMMSFFFVL